MCGVVSIDSRFIEGRRMPATHLELAAEDIFGIDYDYAGPSGCQRKTVTTRFGFYTYHSLNGSWVLVRRSPFPEHAAETQVLKAA